MTPLSVAKDEFMRRLIRYYQAGEYIIFLKHIVEQSLAILFLLLCLLQEVLPGWWSSYVHAGSSGQLCVMLRISY